MHTALAVQLRYNATATPLAPVSLDCALLDRLALLPPQRVLVRGFGGDLTADELLDRALHTARKLRDLGISAGECVALWTRRGADTLVARLAVAAAGAVWLSLDPDHPADRNRQITVDAGVRWLVISPTVSLPGWLSSDQSDDDQALKLRSIPLESTHERRAERVWDTDRDATSAVCAIATSGSSGKAKIALNTHRGWVNLLNTWRKWPGFSAKTRAIAVASPAFDMSVLELFLPVWTGGCVHVVSGEQARDGQRLAEIAEDNGCDWLLATPTTLKLLVQAGWQPAPNTTVVSGGEALSAALAERLLAKGCAVFNGYGVTEAAACSVLERVERTPEGDALGSVCIGRPTENVRAWIVNVDNEPVFPGNSGELVLTGAGVGLGYVNNPAETQARFVRLPWSPDEVAYRTGDRAMYRADGRLVWQGRLDDQVKIGGQRIEPAEIEAALVNLRRGLPAAVVTPHDQKRLVAFVQRHSGDVDDGADDDDDDDAQRDELLRRLQAKLPSGWLPARLEFVDALPSAPGGKVDRALLKARAAEALKPRNGERSATIERAESSESSGDPHAVAAVLTALLKRPIGAHDDFFRCGGDSLLAMRAAEQLRRLRLASANADNASAATIFAGRTSTGIVAQLAKSVPGVGQDATKPAAAERDNLAGMWLAEQLAPHSAAHVTLLALRAGRAIELAQLQGAVDALHRANPALRRRFTRNGEALQITAVRSGAPTVERLSDECDPTSWAPVGLTLDTPRLWKVGLLPGAHDAGTTVWLAVHHAAIDGHAAQTVAREFTRLCGSAEPTSAGDEGGWVGEDAFAIPLTTTASADEARSGTGEGSNVGLGVLPGATSTTSDPSDLSCHVEALRLPTDDVARLERLVDALGTTAFSILAAAFAGWLWAETAASRRSLGTLIAGRESDAAAAQIGFLARAASLRTFTTGSTTTAEACQRMQRAVGSAWANPPPTPPKLDVVVTSAAPIELNVGAGGPGWSAKELPLAAISYRLAVEFTATNGEVACLVRAQRRWWSAASFDEIVQRWLRWTSTALAAPHTTLGALARSVFPGRWGHNVPIAARLQTTALPVFRASGDVADDPARATRSLRPENGAKDREKAEISGDPLAETGPATLVQALDQAAARGVGIQWWDGAAGVDRLDGATLRDRAERGAAALLARGLTSATPVLVCLPAGPEFFVALWTVILAGGAPIPLQFGADPTGAVAARISGCVRDLGVQWLIRGGNAAAAPADVAHVLEWPLESSASAASGQTHPARADDLCLLLLTSGSGGAVKAVQHTHRSLLRQAHGLATHLKLDGDDVWFNWLPPDHVGGVVMCHIAPLIIGAEQVHAPSEAILARPERWLDGLARFRATFSWAPSFAFRAASQHGVAKRNDEDEDEDEDEDDASVIRADLAGVRCLINGGEAVDPDVAERFLAATQPRGLRPDALKPAWGMSETASATIIAAGGWPSVARDEDRVSVGRPIDGVTVRVVDRDGATALSGQTGALEVRGDAVFSGYFGDRERTDAALTASGWLRTGDRAVIADAQVFILGRDDDQIVVNGQNLAASAVENAAVSEAGDRVVAVAAIAQAGVFAPYVLLVEAAPAVREDVARLTAALRDARRGATRTAGAPPAAVVALPVGAMDRTGIGKIRHRLLRRRWEQGVFADVEDTLNAGVSSLSSYHLPNEDEVTDTTLQWSWRQTWPESAATSENASDRGVWPPPNDEVVTVVVLASIGTAGANTPGAPRLWATALDETARRLCAVQAAMDSAPFHTPRDIYILRTTGDAPHDPTTLAVVRAEAALIQTWSQEWSARSPCHHIAYVSGPLVRDADRTALTHFAQNRRKTGIKAGQTPTCALAAVFSVGAGKVWRRAVHKPAITRSPAGRLPWRPGEAVVVTGGLGGVGRRLTNALMQKFGCKVLVCSRRFSGDASQRAATPDQWGQPGNSGSIAVATVDVGDCAALEAAISAFETACDTEVAAVFHLAAIAKSALLADTASADWVGLARARADGCAAIDAVIRARHGTSFIDFGSVHGLVGAVGFGAYAAASQAGAAYVEALRRDGFSAWHVAWSAWDGPGMSDGMPVRANDPWGRAKLSEEAAFASLWTGLRTDAAILSIGLSPQAPNLRDLHEVREDGDPDAALRRRSGDPSFHFESASRPESTSPLESASQTLASDIEQRVAEVWSGVLGRAMTDAGANFFDVGGDSMRAVQLQLRLSEQLSVRFELLDIFRRPTVRAQAAFVVKRRGNDENENEYSQDNAITKADTNAKGRAQSDRTAARKRMAAMRAKRGPRRG